MAKAPSTPALPPLHITVDGPLATMFLELCVRERRLVQLCQLLELIKLQGTAAEFQDWCHRACVLAGHEPTVIDVVAGMQATSADYRALLLRLAQDGHADPLGHCIESRDAQRWDPADACKQILEAARGPLSGDVTEVLTQAGYKDAFNRQVMKWHELAGAVFPPGLLPGFKPPLPSNRVAEFADFLSNALRTLGPAHWSEVSRQPAALASLQAVSQSLASLCQKMAAARDVDPKIQGCWGQLNMALKFLTPPAAARGTTHPVFRDKPDAIFDVVRCVHSAQVSIATWQPGGAGLMTKPLRPMSMSASQCLLALKIMVETPDDGLLARSSKTREQGLIDAREHLGEAIAMLRKLPAPAAWHSHIVYLLAVQARLAEQLKKLRP
ncbi:MAG: hypothetical protein Q7T63_11510 [Burkholderiaceae bacterium]|nr:hypothetical protein [Burkholderiaceae bacterium]